MINQDWDIKPRAAVCGKCQASFADRQEYVSRLTFGSEGYVRLDCCEACWNEANRTPQDISVWHGIFEMPPPTPPEALKKETAESLLRTLIENHFQYTSSRQARLILDNWETYFPLFVKVMPIDYRLALERMRLGEDVDRETVSATEEVFHG